MFEQGARTWVTSSSGNPLPCPSTLAQFCHVVTALLRVDSPLVMRLVETTVSYLQKLPCRAIPPRKQICVESLIMCERSRLTVIFHSRDILQRDPFNRPRHELALYAESRPQPSCRNSSSNNGYLPSRSPEAT